MKKIGLLVLSIYSMGLYPQKSGKFDTNLVLEQSRSFIISKPGSVYSQTTYALRDEVSTSKEKEAYRIEFDMIPNENGKQGFSNMVIGKGPTGDNWSFRVYHNKFTKTTNSDGSLHYLYDFIVDRPNNYEFGIAQRFIAEISDGTVGGKISNLSVTYQENIITNGNIVVNRNMGVNGMLGIGVIHPSVALDVNGTIRSKEVKIEATGWSDFVFNEDYDLLTLQAVEQHINDKGHLPNMPSEKQVIDEGINVVEMQTKLLQKIEELTLYVIEQDKKYNDLKGENTSIKHELRLLKDYLNKTEN